MSPIIYGIHPVEEALKSPHLQLQKIFVGTHTPHSPLQGIINLANEKRVPVVFSTRESLEHMAKVGFTRMW